MLPLARLGLSALDKWYCTLPPHLMEPMLMKVLPHLDPFLRSKGNFIKCSIVFHFVLFLYRWNSPAGQQILSLCPHLISQGYCIFFVEMSMIKIKLFSLFSDLWMFV
jgi:hypothetical protein